MRLVSMVTLRKDCSINEQLFINSNRDVKVQFAVNVKMDERFYTTISSCWMVVAVTKTVVKVLLTLGMMNFNLRSWMP